jgi:hypothetical protein
MSLAKIWGNFFIEGGSHVTDIKEVKKFSHVIYRWKALETLIIFMYGAIWVKMSRFQDIKQNVWSRDHFF